MGNEEAGNRRQETGDSFKPLLPICKTSTPDPLKRVTPARRVCRNYFFVIPCKRSATRIQYFQHVLDTGLRRYDEGDGFFTITTQSPAGDKSGGSLQFIDRKC